jgi:hypothetical protein
MNHIVERESVDMHTFSSASEGIADEMEAVSAHLRHLLGDAADNMRDPSGQEAIAILEELTEQVDLCVGSIRDLAQRVENSARLLEQSDTLL